MAKNKYEISLWEDIFVPESSQGNDYVPGHYEEEKIVVIGSDTMTAQCRAIEPKLVRNINGKVTFTFKMYYRYHDDKTGEDYDNPFLKLLVNERKVKVKWQDEWYDLIIKNIQESTSNKTVIYTCEDANINELAKSGFDIIFDDDLTLNNVSGSNQGTAQELVARTLEGTDWVLGESDTIQQFTEEAVFEVNLIRALPAINMQTSTIVTIPAETDSVATKILIYYPQLADFINNLDTSSSTTISPLYLAYDPKQKYLKLAQTEMLVQADCYKIESCECTIQENVLTFSVNNNVFGRVEYNDISTQYRARRLVYEPVSQIEPISGKSCYVHTVTAVDPSGQYADQVSVGDTVYESIGSEFGDALFATNLIANGASFITTTGWEAPTETPITLTVYPTTAESAGNRSVFLTLPKTTGTARYYYNDAIRANSQYFQDDCRQGETYRIRMKVKRAVGSAYDYCDTSNLQIYPMVAQWEYNTTIGSKYPKDTQYFDVSNAIAEQDNWIRFDLTCINTFTGSDIYRYGIGLFICQPVNTENKYIEEIQFFKIVKDSNGTVILPGELDKTGIINNVYTYFTIKNNDIHYLYQSTEDWNKQGITLVQKYNDNYSKIRAINIKQSNRFNILQTIAETFECWIKFKVEHDPETGKIIYDEHGAPRKEVSIKNEIGEDRGIGFVYGIDLQSISRTVESSQIVTKTIVLENNNEFGEDGTCRISRSEFNYPQIDYILNFDYYINHGLIDGADLNRDLYGRHGTFEDTRGFYSNLHEWNIEFARRAEENARYAIALNKDKGLVNVYTTAIEAAGNELREQKSWITNMAGMLTYEQQETQEFIATYINSSSDIKGHVAAIEAQTQLITFYSDQVEKLQIAIEEYERKIAQNEASMNQLQEYIKAKTKLFNKKYARFISEGSWTDQKYYDDNLYYLDANSVAYTSSRPKVSYNISVMRLSGLEDFKFKDFSLGDISYVEDTDFFGYTYLLKDNRRIKTPYREKVVITEITYNLDEPSKDSFQVQNYRTQFEDLFQRITAQTQTLQYTEGAYNKVSNIIESNGTIKESVLASSVRANNNALNRSALNNSVVTDESGITVTNIANATEQVKITSGGIFITTNGGETWNNAIRGDGVGTQYLSSGAIDTKKITILGENRDSEEAVAFKWDENGITAYDSFSISPNSGQMYDRDRYVRFYKEGVSVQTTTQQGFPYEKVKLGRLNSNNEYGLQINSCDENHQITPVFKATDDGNLSVTGNITATSLTIVPGVTISSNKIQNGDETLDSTISRLDEADGEAIVSDVLHYLATNKSSGVTIEGEEWSTEVQQISSTDRYLWTYHTYTYGNGNTSNTTPIITGVYGEMGTTISSIQYNTGTSATQVPAGEWSNTPVSVSEGHYLWTRTTYSDGSIAYSVARQGEDGGTAVSIASVKNYYLATNLSSGVTKEDPNWKDTVQSMTAEKQYLWNYEVVLNTTGGVISSTDPVIIGRYGQDGKDGHEGEDGRGIVSITEHYQVSNSNTTPPETWSDQVVNTTTVNRYLWNYETIAYTDNTSEDTAKRVIGTHGETGTRGATWYAGTKIDGTSTTAQTFPQSGITSAMVGDHYLNTTTQNVYVCTVGGDASSAKWKFESNIKGTDGAPGKEGTDGTSAYFHVKYSDDGGQSFTPGQGETPGAWIGTYTDDNATDSTSVSSYTWIKIEGHDGDSVEVQSVEYAYQLSTSGTEIPSGTWSTTPVAPTTTQFAWTRTTTTFTDGKVATTYTVGGKTGTNGSRGATWYAGTGITGTSTTAQTFPQSGVSSAIVGDHYLNTSTQNVYRCTTKGAASVAKWVYEQNIKGTDGAPGTPGTDGKTAYFHVKYSNDGGQSFTPAQGSTPAGETPGPWIGTYTDNTEADSGSVSSYKWIKIEGEDGQDGQDGKDGQDGVSPTITTSKTGKTTTIQITDASGQKTATIVDGQDGTPATVYYLQTSTYSIVKNAAGALSPTKVTFSAKSKTGTSNPVNYTGRLVIEESTDGSTWATKYDNDAASREHGPDATSKFIRCSLYLTGGKTTLLDQMTVAIVSDGANGTSITITKTEYQSGTSATSAPTGTWSTTPVTVAEGNFLWTKVTYSDGNVTYSVAKQGKSGTNGTDGTSVTVSKIEYQSGTSNTTAPTGTWSTSPVTVAEGNYLWTKTTFSDNKVAYSVAKQGKSGTNGTNGTNGYNQATLYLYKRSSSTITTKPSARTYTFSTGTLSSASDGWTREIPSGTDPCYVTSVSVRSQTDSVTIAQANWASVIKLVQNGTDGKDGKDGTNGTNGTNGANGFNSVTIQLYQRAASVPTTMPGTLTYTFATGALTGTFNNWQTEIPTDNGKPCYLISATVLAEATQATDTIASSEWTTPIQLVISGEDGAPGEDGKDAYTIILSNESHTFAGGTSAAIASSTECQIIAYKGATQVAAHLGEISGKPTGMTVTPSGSGTTSAKITVAVTNQMTTKNGVLTIPITVDGHSFTKEFTYSLALTGAKGDTGERGAAGVSSTGLFMRVNASTFTNTNAGECYFHGYNSENVAADVPGWVMWNGAKLTITNGMWINPNTVAPYNTTILHVYRTSNSSEVTKHCDVWWDEKVAKWRGYNYTGSGVPATVSDWTWNEATDCILATYVSPSSEGSITSAQLFDPPKKFSEIPDPTTQNDRTRYQQPIKAETDITAGSIIVGTSFGYHNLIQVDEEGELYTFDLAYPILYANSSIAAGQTGNDNYLVIPFDVTTTQSIELEPYKPVYIEGNFVSSRFVPISTSPITQIGEDNGHSYILLGTAYSSTGMYLTAEHSVFRFKDEIFQSVTNLSLQANEEIDSIKNDLTKVQSAAQKFSADITDLSSGLGILQSSTKDISKLVTSLSSDFGNLNNYVSTDSNGIAIKATNSDFGIYITAGDIQFRKGNATLAQFAGEQFIIDKGTLITELNIRPFVWMVRSNGHLSLVYRGQEE